jgi:ParB-like chromosome segregation protein Spo0J
MLDVKTLPINELKPNSRNARTHSKRQIRQLADSIKSFGFLVPILVDDDRVVIAGHGRYAAAKLLGLQQVPVIEVTGLSEAKCRALALADNKIAANGGWDRERLAKELPELGQLLVLEDLDITITGFAPVEIDNLIADLDGNAADPADTLKTAWASATPLSKRGDLWILGRHRLLCGDARNAEDVARLMADEQATMAFLDPPYEQMQDMLARGPTEHSAFATVSGEVSSAELVTFLTETLDAVAAVSLSDAIHYVGADWRHLAALIEAGRSVYDEMLDLIVWVKSTADQGSFYRNQHELIGVFRVAAFPDLNVKNKLTRRGRSRSNVWKYSSRAGRLDQLKGHPTERPVALVADALQDYTRRGEIVIDVFGGFGTTILAAERVGRRAYTMEIEPRLVDAAIKRWQEFSGQKAIHADSGLTFDELANEATHHPEAEPANKEAA